MRISLVIAGAGIGGTERHVELLLVGLANLGHSVRLLSSRDGPLVDKARAVGAETAIIPRPNGVTYVSKLLRELKRTRPDVLHSHSGRLPCIAGRMAGIPAIVDTRHGLIVPSLGTEPDSAARWRWEAAKCRLAHTTILLSKQDRDRLVGRGGFPAHRAAVVYNGVPLPKDDGTDVAGSETRFRLGFLGRLSKEKKPHRMLDLIRLLVGTGGPLTDTERHRLILHLVGDGPMRGELEARVAEEELGEHVRFHGRLEDVNPILREIGALLLPSVTEGMPYALLEAMAARTPFLATPVGGIPELVGPDLEAALLPWDPADWAEGLLALFRDDAHRQSRIKAGWERAKSLSVERMVEETCQVYARLLG